MRNRKMKCIGAAYLDSKKILYGNHFRKHCEIDLPCKHYGTVTNLQFHFQLATGRVKIVNRLCNCCFQYQVTALRNFHDVNSVVTHSELETTLKACVHIKMMYNNLVEATFL